MLRRWCEADRSPFAALNADPVVMEHYPGVLDRVASDARIDALEEEFDRRGFGLWAVEVPGVTPLAGYVGLSVPTFEAHFTPAVEVGWRFARAHWGQGYATEGAAAAVAFGFGTLGLDEIVSLAIPANERSLRVMARLGMSHDPADDFDHPRFPPGNRLCRHVLYRLAPPRGGRELV